MFSAKPYQVWRRRPSAVSLGSSRVEVGIDPRHRGWVDTDALQFRDCRASTSYEVMLAFLHAQSVGAPLKQAVVGLDFFGFNINFDLGAEQQQARFARDGIAARSPSSWTKDLQATRSRHPRRARNRDCPREPGVERSALSCGQSGRCGGDCAQGVRVRARALRSDRRTQRRDGGSVPADWDEADICRSIPTWRAAIAQGGWFLSGYHQYLVVGRSQGPARRVPAGRLERRPVISPPIRRRAIEMARAPTGPAISTMSRIGLSQGLAGGLPPRGLDRMAAPALADPGQERCSSCSEGFRLVLSRARPEAQWAPCCANRKLAHVRRSRGARLGTARRGAAAAGRICRVVPQRMLAAGSWCPTLAPPRLMYCFTNRGPA